VIATQVAIGVHGSTLTNLDARTRYLLSCLRQRRFQARVATYQQDQGWQASLPVCPQITPGQARYLPSDVVATFLNMSNGTICSARGVLFGFTGSGVGRRPVFLSPWEYPNPHMVVIGQSGTGKSFGGKLLVTGIMGQGLADVVVLDRD